MMKIFLEKIQNIQSDLLRFVLLGFSTFLAYLLFSNMSRVYPLETLNEIVYHLNEIHTVVLIFSSILLGGVGLVCSLISVSLVDSFKAAISK